MSEENAGTTLAEARQFVKDCSNAGVTCPCCDQYVKVYGRSLHTSMARVLVALHEHFEADPGLDYLHVSQFPRMPFNINGDYNYLKHWGLLVPHPQNVGFWKVTELGHRFARGEIKVKKKVFLLNNVKVGESDKEIDIHQALGHKREQPLARAA